MGCSRCVFLLGLGTTLAQSTRERAQELTLRKSNNRGRIAATVIVTEALAISLCAAALGLAVAYLIAPTLFERLDLALSKLPAAIFALGFATALPVGLAGSVLPAIRALRTNAVGS